MSPRSLVPPLSLVRALVRAGAHDVVPLPLSIEDLETSLAPVADGLTGRETAAATNTAKLVSVIKGVGGAGATHRLGVSSPRGGLWTAGAPPPA